jgi:hypothetical protein
MDRRAAGEMEIPHRKCFLSAFFGIPPCKVAGLQGGSWHIHPPQGNGWYAREQPTVMSG